MAEIVINRTIMFLDGFVIESSQNLLSGTSYNLNINDGTINTNKTYIPSLNGTAIIDNWGSQVPSDTNVCFTLSDTSCPPILCNLIIT